MTGIRQPVRQTKQNKTVPNTTFTETKGLGGEKKRKKSILLCAMLVSVQLHRNI